MAYFLVNKKHLHKKSPKLLQKTNQLTEFIKRRQQLCIKKIYWLIHTHSQIHSYRHELSTGADKLSEAQQEVLFSWENLGQLKREMTRKWEW